MPNPIIERIQKSAVHRITRRIINNNFFSSWSLTTKDKSNPAELKDVYFCMPICIDQCLIQAKEDLLEKRNRLLNIGAREIDTIENWDFSRRWTWVEAICAMILHFYRLVISLLYLFPTFLFLTIASARSRSDFSAIKGAPEFCTMRTVRQWYWNVVVFPTIKQGPFVLFACRIETLSFLSCNQTGTPEFFMVSNICS